MVYNEVTTLAISVSGAIGPVGPTSNFGRLFIILIGNTSVVTKVEYRPIKMPLTPYFMLVTTRGQRSILCLTINPTRGQYHANGTTLMSNGDSSQWTRHDIFMHIYFVCMKMSCMVHLRNPQCTEATYEVLRLLICYELCKLHDRLIPAHIYLRLDVNL